MVGFDGWHVLRTAPLSTEHTWPNLFNTFTFFNHNLLSSWGSAFWLSWESHPWWALKSFVSSGMSSSQTWGPRTKTCAPPSTSRMSPWSAKMASGSPRTGWCSPPPAGSSKTCYSNSPTLNPSSSWGASLSPPWLPWSTSSTLGRFTNIKIYKPIQNYYRCIYLKKKLPV